jgi:hypothetical protein
MKLSVYNSVLLATQNFIGSFDFNEVFLYSYVVTCQDVTMHLNFVASTIIVCVMQNPLFLSSYSPNNFEYYFTY